MKITSFNPMIVSKDAESIISLFEALGFEKRHTPTVNAGHGDVKTTRMKDANGNYIDIVSSDSFSQDLTEIRINVDDLEEACRIFTTHGFQNTRGDATVDLKSSKTAVMRSPSGCMVSLVKHIKEHD